MTKQDKNQSTLSKRECLPSVEYVRALHVALGASRCGC